MKCRKYNCVLSQEACILRREMIDLLNFEGKPIISFYKCQECMQGEWVSKNYPMKELDLDVLFLKMEYGHKLKKIEINKKFKPLVKKPINKKVDVKKPLFGRYLVKILVKIDDNSKTERKEYYAK